MIFLIFVFQSGKMKDIPPMPWAKKNLEGNYYLCLLNVRRSLSTTDEWRTRKRACFLIYNRAARGRETIGTKSNRASLMNGPASKIQRVAMQIPTESCGFPESPTQKPTKHMAYRNSLLSS